MMSERQCIHFVTGKLAEHALRKTLDSLAPQAGFDYTIEVLNITVAALMTTEWVAARIHPSPAASKVLLPGYCQGELAPVEQATGLPVERGPRDLRRLPEYFGGESARRSDYGGFDIEILAEINHAPQLELSEILRMAAALRADGADVIDVGCDPGAPWSGVRDCVLALRAEGHRVSIDSMQATEISAACQAGAELVLSVNSSNRECAADWGCQVVVVPDDPATLAGLDESIEYLADRRVPLRIDPVLEPIGFGFAESLARYLEVRRRFPDAEMMMGIGNLTELTDADSAAINVLLLGFCQELSIHSVLTTQVINWARSSVKECDLARRLVFHAVRQRMLPKHVEPQLVMLRDPQVPTYGEDELKQLAARIKDRNYRIFADAGRVHVLSANLHLTGDDAFALFAAMQAAAEREIDSAHAFYLGYEMAKAVTALTLGKDYRQDEALDWGFLTVLEVSHRHKQAAGKSDLAEEPSERTDLPR